MEDDAFWDFSFGFSISGSPINDSITDRAKRLGSIGFFCGRLLIDCEEEAFFDVILDLFSPVFAPLLLLPITFIFAPRLIRRMRSILP